MDDWRSWRDELERALGGAAGATAVVDVVPGPGAVAPRRGLRALLPGSAAASAFVQVVVLGPEGAQVEVSGGRRHGGGVDWSPQTEAALLSLGLVAPDDPRRRGDLHGTSTWAARRVEDAAADGPWSASVPRPVGAAADLVVAILRGPCRVASPDGLRISVLS